MASSREYKDFVKGDELAILNILKDGNCRQSLISKVIDRLHYMQAHSCLFGQEIVKEGVKTLKQQEEYLELLDKYEKLQVERDNLFMENQKYKKEYTKLQRKLMVSV